MTGRAPDAHPRDFVGRGREPVDPAWPGGARVAVQFALNYEAGGELCVLNGDPSSEGTMTDFGIPAMPGARQLLVESSFEYGSRCGAWRVLRLFEQRALRISVFAVGLALSRNPDFARAATDAGHEIVCHGWRWIDYADVPEDVEREHIRLAVSEQLRLTGARPQGAFLGRPSLRTRRLLVEAGFLYDQDACNDDLPYWTQAGGSDHLVVPFAFDTNDNRFAIGGLSTGDEFFAYLRDAFDLLYAEGADSPKLMTVGLHDRLAGRPARAAGLARFLDHVLAHERVWVCRGIDVAQHWRAAHPPPAATSPESR